MNKKKSDTASAIKNILIFVFLLVLLIPCTVSASGFKIDQQGSKALGMGDAFVATADDPSAIYFNPAGLADQQDPALYLGASVLAPSIRFRNPSGMEEETIREVFIPPHFYFNFPVRGISFGFGVYAPFGIGTTWNDTGLTRYQATESDIRTLNMNPSIAVKVRPWLLLGVGADYLISDANLKKMVDQSLVGGSDAKTTLEGGGSGWGYNAGIIVIPDKRLRLGVSYRSTIMVKYSGSATLDDIAPALQPLFGGTSYRTNAGTSIKFPARLTIGAAYKPSEKVTLALDFEKTYWSSFKSLNIDLENEVAPVFTDTSEPKDWNNIWAVRAGFEYRATGRVSIRGGYVYQNNPAPEQTLEPRLPDSDQHDISFGIGYKASNHLVIDAAYMFAYLEGRDVENSILSGRYNTTGHSVGLSIGYKF